MKLFQSLFIALALTFGSLAAAAPPTLILKNNFGDQYTWSILGGNAPAGVSLYGRYLQRVSIGFAALNAATTGVPVSLGTAIPDDAIITNVYYNVLTTFLDSGTAGNADTSTLSIGANTNVDLKAAVSIANGANAWDAGIGAGIPVGTAATMVKLTAARSIKVTWTAGTGDATALVAGQMDVFVEYVLGQ